MTSRNYNMLGGWKASSFVVLWYELALSGRQSHTPGDKFQGVGCSSLPA